MPESVGTASEGRGGKVPPPRPSSPEERFGACTRPRHVVRRLLRVTAAVESGEMDPNTANAMTNAYRAILQALTGQEIDDRLETLESAAARAAAAADGRTA